MHRVLFLFLVVLIVSGCVSQQVPSQKEGVLQGTTDPYSKRDNVNGQEYYSNGEGVGLITSEKSFDDFAEEEYKETLKDINVSSIVLDCEEHENVLQRDYCFQGMAVEKSNVSACEKITDVSIKRQCIRAVAIALLDPAVCKKIDLENGIYNCIARIASDDDVLDERLCSEIPSENVWNAKCIALVQKETEQLLSSQ